MRLTMRTYFLILTLLLVSGGNAHAAVTDPIQNAIEEATLYVDAGGTIQEDVNLINVDAITGKMGQLGDLQAVAKAAKKVEAQKKKIENVAKKADKLQKDVADVKEKADNAKKRIDNAKGFVDKQKSNIAKAKAVVAKAKAAKDKLKGYVDDAKGYYDKAQSYVADAKGYINDAKEMAAAAKSIAQEKTGKTPSRNTFGTNESETLTTLPGASTSEDIPSEDVEDNLTYLPEDSTEGDGGETEANKLNAISNFAEEAAVSDIPLPLASFPTVENQTALTADEVAAAAGENLAADEARLAQLKAENPDLSDEELEQKLAEEKGSAASDESMLDQLLAEKDAAKLEELRAVEPTLSEEELKQRLQQRDEDKKASLTHEDAYTWEESAKKMQAKDEAKLQSLKVKSPRRAFGRGAAVKGEKHD